MKGKIGRRSQRVVSGKSAWKGFDMARRTLYTPLPLPEGRARKKEVAMMDSIRAFWAESGATVMTVAWRVFLALAILAVCRVTSLFTRKAIRMACNRAERLDPTLAPVLCSIASVTLYAIGGVAVLDLFGVNANSLVAIIGAAGLAIGLALKDTLSNIAAGIMLLILRPFRAGDVVDCGARSGKVEAINLFNVVLRTADGLFVSLPNSTVWASDIVNYTRNGTRRLSITIGLSYADDLDRGLDVLRAVAAAEPRLLPDPAPDAVVASLTENAVNLTLRGWTTTEDYWRTLFDLSRRVKLEIEAAGLTIAHPQRAVHLIPPPAK